MTGRKKSVPSPIGDVVGEFLSQSGLAKRVRQATAIEEWPAVVGEKIASVTKALSITPDGTLFVAVATHGWMTELSLMEPELLKALNAVRTREKVRKIRYRLDG